MRRLIVVFIAALIALGPQARPVAAAGADHLFFSLNPVASLTSGTLFNVEVQARDSSQGNAVDAGFIGNVTLTAAAVGGSSFTAGNVVAATNGVASFNVFLNNAANTYQITASAAGPDRRAEQHLQRDRQPPRVPGGHPRRRGRHAVQRPGPGARRRHQPGRELHRQRQHQRRRPRRLELRRRHRRTRPPSPAARRSPTSSSTPPPPTTPSRPARPA